MDRQVTMRHNANRFDINMNNRYTRLNDRLIAGNSLSFFFFFLFFFLSFFLFAVKGSRNVDVNDDEEKMRVCHWRNRRKKSQTGEYLLTIVIINSRKGENICVLFVFNDIFVLPDIKG